MDWEDMLLIGIPLALMVGFLVLCGYAQEKGKEECEKNGGIVIERYASHQCLTKEDLQKLRGER